ncbi:MAG TPA: alpha/beta hydrolase [Longilinea sp.]|nr:alpha/beta hydrolase [Longilinea sp.]
MIDKRLNINGVEIQFHEYPHAETAIVFLHFGGGNLMMWQKVIPHFQADFHLILPDIRGHGRSSKLLPSAHIDDMAADIAGLLDQLNIQKAHIVGSSLGAEVGLSLAANYPQKVVSLVCDGALTSEFGPYGTYQGTETEFKAFVAEQMNDIRSNPVKVFPSVAAYIAGVRPVWENNGWWNECTEAFLSYNTFEVKPGEFVKSWQKADMEKYMEQYFYTRFEEYYRRVTCPVLMLPGEDAWNDENESAAIKKMSTVVANAKVVAVPGWVHPYGWMLQPEAMCKVVGEYIHQAQREVG